MIHPAHRIGILLAQFALALLGMHADGDRGGHALQRACHVTFGWGGML
nr:hypothetical protein OG461_16065 [Streptomyces sp. NBC_00995]